MQDLLSQPLNEWQRRLRQREFSCVELLSHVLTHSQAVNSKINAIVSWADSAALFEHANYLDQLAEKNLWLGHLHGIPFSVKDSINVVGLPTTQGTLGLKNFIPPYEAMVVQRLKQAGGYVYAKTNVPELCIAAECDNLVFGQTRNPYQLNCTSGGSSGGEAAIVASASPFGVAADTIGSLRIPAHYCGLTTLRATVGRVPSSFSNNFHSYGFDIGMFAAMATHGVLARHVEDLTYLMPLLAGADGVDPKCVDLPWLSPDSVSVRNFKIGCFIDDGHFAVDNEIQHALTTLYDTCRQQNLQLTEALPVCTVSPTTIMSMLLESAEIDLVLQARLQQVGSSPISPSLQAVFDWYGRHRDIKKNYQEALVLWQKHAGEMTRYLANFDVVLCPVLPCLALKLGKTLWSESLYHAAGMVFYGALTPSCSAVVRVGTSKDGLPIGVQILAKPWQEHKVLAMAAFIEKCMGGWQAPIL